jgi:predicted aldo/keto reductase-like oxidoreductase
MKYRRFGRTELQIPVFSCGGMRYQHGWKDETPDQIPRTDQENLEKTIHRALELGINHIETARGYGTSEMQLGWVLPHLPRESLIIQTKVSPAKDPKEFLAAFEKSMEYLRLDYIDLFSFHGVNIPEILEWILRKGGCMKIVRKLQRDGRIRHVGFSTHGTSELITEAVNTGEFDYVNLHWYFINNANWPAIQAARAQDMGVFIISPTDKGGMLFSPPEKLRTLCEPLTPIQFNDLYCLARPEVHTLSIGASRPTDFDEHVSALAHYERAAEVTEPIAQRLQSELEKVMGPDWLHEWETRLPHWHDVPGEINLREILRLWTLAKSLDLVEFGKMRYNLLGQAGHWFPGKPADSFDEASLASVLLSSRYAERIPSILREAHEMLKAAPKKRLSESD